MRVLVTESKPGRADGIRRRLTERGHVVTVCHSDKGSDFHCAGITGHGCPLDLGAVDVVIDVRDHDPEFTTREYGVVCAHRASVPLVVAGAAVPFSHGQPLESVAVQCDEPGAVDAVEHAVELPDTTALHALRTVVREVLGRLTGDERVTVSLVDHGFYVDVVIRTGVVPSAAVREELTAAVRNAMSSFRPDWTHTRAVFRAGLV